MNATVKTAVVTQSASDVLGMPEKKIYYLLIETDKGKLTINIGEKTFTNVNEFTDVITKIESIGGKP